MAAKTFAEIAKFNPYHDSKGRFASADSAASFTYAPGKSTAHDKAIQRGKESAETGKGFKGTLYHGSPATDIKEFDIERAGMNTSSGEKLIYFTDSKQMAEDFSYERLEGSSKYFQRRGEKGRVYEVEVEMKNPLDLRNLTDKDIDNILQLDVDGILTKDMVRMYAQKNHQLLKSGLELTSESLKSLGYDGLIANTGKAGHNSLEYAVVDSSQTKIIKAAPGAMTFDDILKFNPYHDQLGRFTTAPGGGGVKKLPAEIQLMQDAIAHHLKKNGVTVHDDNTVTLYHVTSKENAASIRENGFRGTDAPVGGMTGENIKPRSFFGFDREWVESTWSSDGYETMEIRVPAQYIRQGAQNKKEVYIEGNITHRGNGVWEPDVMPTSTFYDRKAIKRYQKEVENNDPEVKKSMDDSRAVLFIGLKISGTDSLAIKGGEDPEDFHVTLAYGHFDTNGHDEDDIAVRVRRAVDQVKVGIPDTIHFDAIGRFPASKSSDGKDVIYAQVTAGQLEEAHTFLLSMLKEQGIELEDTFTEYKPHMTLAYIDPGTEYELGEINATGTTTQVMIGHGWESSHENEYTIAKIDEDQRLVFGWASISIKVDGEQLEDRQEDLIDPEDLEEAAYEYVLHFRDTGELHNPDLRKKGKLVESCVFTAEKQKAMGIPEGILPVGWWIGFKIEDDEAWEKVKNRTYKMFSIEGKANRVPVEKAAPVVEDPPIICKSDPNRFDHIEEFP
jgi:2'-5' RNA ligase